MAPRSHQLPRPGPRRGNFMATQKSTAHPAHPSTEDHDDRPHACLEGVVYVGHLVVGEDGEEVKVIEAVPCRRCADSR